MSTPSYENLHYHDWTCDHVCWLVGKLLKYLVYGQFFHLHKNDPNTHLCLYQSLLKTQNWKMSHFQCTSDDWAFHFVIEPFWIEIKIAKDISPCAAQNDSPQSDASTTRAQTCDKKYMTDNIYPLWQWKNLGDWSFFCISNHRMFWIMIKVFTNIWPCLHFLSTKKSKSCINFIKFDNWTWCLLF